MSVLVQSPAGHKSFSADPRFAAISETDVEAAIRTILSWIGEDPDREGLRETPLRMVRAFAECFSGYSEDPALVLSKAFRESEGVDEMIVLKRIPFQSHCEHHFAPIVGHACVGYIPRRKIVGVSKLARVVEAYAKRLQLQERMTAQIANTIEAVLKPRGVGVVIKATHDCMNARGVRKKEGSVMTNHMLGAFRDIAVIRQEFLSAVNACL